MNISVFKKAEMLILRIKDVQEDIDWWGEKKTIKSWGYTPGLDLPTLDSLAKKCLRNLNAKLEKYQKELDEL